MITVIILVFSVIAGCIFDSNDNDSEDELFEEVEKS